LNDHGEWRCQFFVEMDKLMCPTSMVSVLVLLRVQQLNHVTSTSSTGIPIPKCAQYG
jgi:hypothetical protein